MKKKATKKVKRINKKKNNRFLPILFFALGIVAIISTVYIVTTQWTELRSRAQTSKGWLSGSSDIAGEIDGKPEPEMHWQKFEAWRGSPVTIAGTWSDATAGDQENMWAYNNYKDFPHSLDLSVGAYYDGESFAAIANGSLDTRLKKALANVDANWNSKPIIFLRFAHEFNGSWYRWSVKSSNVEDYKKAFQHFHALVQSELIAKGRNAKVVWSPNDGNHSDIAIQQMWPGDQYVDVIGVDSYDWDPQRNESNWETAANAMEGDGSPRGIESWRKFAESKGKPLSFPEWGCNPDKTTPPVDCPFYIQKMNDYFRTHAGTTAGKVWYEIYFNSYVEKTRIFPTTKVPQAAAMYQSLKWGDGGVVTNPSTTLPSTNTPSQAFISVSPPFVCGGSQYCVPSTTVPPENPGTNPPVDISQTVNPSGVVENPQENPDGNDDEDNNDNDGDNNGNDNGNNHGDGKGLFDLLLELFRLIIEFFMKLFGK